MKNLSLLDKKWGWGGGVMAIWPRVPLFLHLDVLYDIEPQFLSSNILIGFWISTTVLVTKLLKFSGITWLFSAG